MVSEETEEMIREAFNKLSHDRDLQGWQLDIGWAYHDLSTDDLQVNLVRGEKERSSITVHPGIVLQREGDITIHGLMKEILNKLIERGLVPATI